MSQNVLMGMTYVLLWVLIIVATGLQLGILRHLGFLYQIADPIYRFTENETRLQVGSKLPSIPLIDRAGTAVRMKEITGRGRSLLLVVQHPCVPCAEHLTAIVDGRLSSSTIGANFVLIVQGARTEAEALKQASWLLKDFAIPEDVPVLMDFTRGAWRKWEVRTPPYAIVLNREGRVVDRRSGLSTDEILDTLRNVDRTSVRRTEGVA